MNVINSILILIVLAASCHANPVRQKVLGISKHLLKFYGSFPVKVPPSPYQTHRVQFKFPLPSTPGLSTIRRIETVDAAKKPSIFEILEGGIGSKSATIAVTSQEGGEIDSTFRFYGDETESSGNEGSTSDPNATPSATSAEQPTPMPTLSPEYISQEEAELNSMAERMFSKFDFSKPLSPGDERLFRTMEQFLEKVRVFGPNRRYFKPGKNCY